MQTITIGFSKHHGNAIGSSLIQWFMGRPYSHTYFKFKEDRYKDKTIFHAVGHGTVYISETTFLENNVPVYEFEIEISDELFNELMIDCHQNAGKSYGYMQNLGLVLVRTLNRIGFDIKKNPIDDGINCSEWIYYILEEVYGQWTATEPNLVAPDEICDYLLKKGMKSIV